MKNNIFNAFLILFVAVILWLLPQTSAIADFITDLRTDTLSATTAVAATTANVTLLDSLYDDDIGSVAIFSDDDTDTPLANSYNTTSRALNITGLTANATRVLEVTYDIDALGGSPAVVIFVGNLPFIWLIVIAVFPMAAIFVIFRNRG